MIKEQFNVREFWIFPSQELDSAPDSYSRIQNLKLVILSKKSTFFMILSQKWDQHLDRNVEGIGAGFHT